MKEKKRKTSIKDKVHMKAILKKIDAREIAYESGRGFARKWMRSASHQEIIDVLPRSNPHNDANYFTLIRNLYFVSMEKRYPDETERFKWFNNVDFMKGWREEVILIWNGRCENKSA